MGCSSGTASAAGALLPVMPLPAEMGKVWVGNKCQTCNMHTSSYIVLSIIMIDMRDVYAVKDYVALAGRLC